MTVYSTEFTFKTRGEFDVVDITSQVAKAVSKSCVQRGIALVYAGHATGIIILNEHEGALLDDLKELMKKLAPLSRGYNHPRNAHAHLRSMIFTPSRVIPVSDGRLSLGTWQSLYWVEAETRPRLRQVTVTIIGE